MNTGKIIGGVLVAAGAGAGVYFAFIRKGPDGLSLFSRLMKRQNDSMQPATNIFTGKPSSPSSSSAGDSFPLKIGSSGPNVKKLQVALNKLKPSQYTALVADGNFGNLTYTAVVTWVGTGYYPVSQESLDYIVR